jgi:hypothetical protein
MYVMEVPSLETPVTVLGSAVMLAEEIAASASTVGRVGGKFTEPIR